MNYIDLFNNNQGVIEAIGLFLVIPFSLFGNKIIEFLDNQKNKKGIEEILQHELWVNLNYVSQIEESFNNTIKDGKAHHVPHYPPRNEVLGKIVEFNFIKPLKNRVQLLEIYAQLSELKEEFVHWREVIPFKNNRIDKDLYKIQSSTILSIVDPLMRNMIDLWLRLLLQQKSKHLNIEVQCLKEQLQKKIRNGEWLITTYKSSRLPDNFIDKDKHNFIVCWINDSANPNKKIIEIKNKVALFDSWKNKTINI